MVRLLSSFVLAFGVVAAYGLYGAASASAEPMGVDTGAPPPKAEEPPPKYPEVNQALEDFKKRDLDECKKKLEAAAKKYTDLPPAQIILVGWFAASNQTNAVLPTLEDAVKSDPNDPEAYIIFGDLDLQNHRIAGAALFFDKANELLAKFNKSEERKKIMEPCCAERSGGRGRGAAEVARGPEDLEALLKLTPKDTRAMQRLANTLFQQKDAGGALEKLKEAYEIDPKTVLTPDATLATFYEQFGDHEDAEKRMNIAVGKAPTDLRTWMVAGRWALETGEMKEAEKFAENAMQIDPKSLDARMPAGRGGLVPERLQDGRGMF